MKTSDILFILEILTDMERIQRRYEFTVLVSVKTTTHYVHKKQKTHVRN